MVRLLEELYPVPGTLVALLEEEYTHRPLKYTWMVLLLRRTTNPMCVHTLARMGTPVPRQFQLPPESVRA